MPWCPHAQPPQWPTLERGYARCRGGYRHPPHRPPPRPDDLATMGRLRPTSPARNQDALLQTAGRTASFMRLRRPICKAANSHYDHEPLHGAWNTDHAARWLTPARGEGTGPRDDLCNRAAAFPQSLGEFPPRPGSGSPARATQPDRPPESPARFRSQGPVHRSIRLFSGKIPSDLKFF